MFAGLLVIIVIVAVELQLFLDPGDKGGYLVEWYLALLEDVRVLAIELAGGFFGVWIEDHLLQEYGVNFLLGITCSLLVVDTDDGRLETHTQAQVDDPVIAHLI